MKKYYEKINDIKHDIEQNLNLGFSSLLSKDQKFYKWNNKTKIIWSSLNIPYIEIKKRFGDQNMINIYLTYYEGKTIEDKSNTFYITNSPVEEKWRLFTIYNPIKLPFNKE